MDTAEAADIIRAEIQNRRRKLADSGIDDRTTRAVVRLLGNVVISEGAGTITATLPIDSAYDLIHADGVLTAALDPVPGAVRYLTPYSYRLTLAGQQ